MMGLLLLGHEALFEDVRLSHDFVPGHPVLHHDPEGERVGEGEREGRREKGRVGREKVGGRV